MKTLIVYATKYGAAEECAKKLAEKIGGDADVVNLKESSPQNLSAYDKIIVGGSIYAGQIQRTVKDFCAKNAEALKSKTLGLYVSCMSEEAENIKSAFGNAFPAELIEHSAAAEALGGKLSINKMKFFDKLIAKIMTKKSDEEGRAGGNFDGKSDFSTISDKKISEFADKIKLAV